ncbi:glycoside hydrolase family 31 protein [soil metagenome]
MQKIFLFVFFIASFVGVHAQTISTIENGIWKIVFGQPEQILPDQFKAAPKTAALAAMPIETTPAISLSQIKFKKTAAGITAEIDAADDERFYGFGLQINSFEQRGMRRDIRINSWPVGNVGFSHAAMPFYISSKGYGVLINTCRYTTFYAASLKKMDAAITASDTATEIKLSTEALYAKNNLVQGKVNVIVAGTEGMEIYIINGPTLQNVMQRYNLFSGGGSLPPLWGLGFQYRAKASSTADQVQKIADYFREKKIPCDVMGLETGWQTNAYSSSFVWNKANFPNPENFTQSMIGKGYKVNLWEHAYTAPNSPIYKAIAPYSADYKVWNGAVPDFNLPQAKAIFGDYHEEQFITKGIAAFKLDESDGADYKEAHAEWSYPDITQFPSGIDGIQMRQLYGTLYQQTIHDIYKKYNRRTFFDVRSSYLFSSPFSSALYSDMYSHADYVRMVCNTAFSGLSWSPELRESKNDADLIRRIQTTVMSSHMVANCWYLNMPPWLQYDTDKNVKGELLSNANELEQLAKKMIDIRMSLLPYIYAAYAKYHFDGTPVFRPLVMDYPNDKHTWKMDDEYMMGESILCAPFIDSSSVRNVYFPAGNWYDFNNNKKYQGDSTYQISMGLNDIPMFVKDNTILPLAKPLQFIADSSVFDITCKIYGQPSIQFNLFEDNTFNNNFEKSNYNWLSLSWKNNKGKLVTTGNYKGKLYRINGWEVIK